MGRARTVRPLDVAATGLIALVIGLSSSPLAAQPAGPWLAFPGPDSGYVEVAHDPALNPTEAITVETWLYLNGSTGTSGNSCPSLVGKGYGSAYWLGVCGGHIRFYSQGSNSGRTGLDALPTLEWVHIAVTYDGATLTFYRNGVVDRIVTDISGPLTTNDKPVRIGSDVDYDYSPDGYLSDVRLWNVARSQEEVVAGMSERITSPRAGLVASWTLAGDTTDAVGGFDGSLHGTTDFPTTIAPPCRNRRFIPAAAHSLGVGESRWVSDLSFLNTAASAVDVELRLLPRARDNSSWVSTEAKVEAGSSLALADVVLATFGESNLGAALMICSSDPVRLWSRTYNLAASGTFGQGIPAVAVDDLAPSGSPAYLYALAENAEFRTNVGFVNANPFAITVAADLYSAHGELLGAVSYPLPPYGYIQRNRIFREVTPDAVAAGWMAVVAEGGRVIAYASVVDAGTDDGTFYLAE